MAEPPNGQAPLPGPRAWAMQSQQPTAPAGPGAAPSEAWRWWSGVRLRVEREGRVTRLRLERDGGVLVHDLPAAPQPPGARGAAQQGLPGEMIRCHARETPQPVSQRHVAADGEAEVSPLGLAGVREVRQARRPRPPKGPCPWGLERRFRVEDDDRRRVGGHASIQVLRTEGAPRLGAEVPPPRVVACAGALGCRHRDRRLWARVQPSRRDASPLRIGQMCPDTLIWGHCSGHLIRAQRATIRAHCIVCAARGSRL
jgi:hypothetical protein